MGLILGPIIILWLCIAVYAFKMGYSLMTSYVSLSHSVILAAIICISLSIYLYLGFSGFKNSKELGAFDIASFFILSKPPYLFLIVAIIFQWFGGAYLDNIYVKPLPFIIIFTLSFGSLIGVFSADFFMDKFNITKTY